MSAHEKRQHAFENNIPSQMLALEPRYLFDAAVVTTVADATSTPTTDTSSATPDVIPPATLEADPEPASVSEKGFIYSENHANDDIVGFITTSENIDTFTITPETDTGTFTLVQSDSTHLRIDVLDNSLLDYEDGPILSGLTGALADFNGEPGLAFDVTVTEDDTATEDTATILILFRDVNDAPEAATPDDSLIGLGETATVQVSATDQDIDGDSADDLPAWSIITYDLESPPDGASIDENGLFSWTPTEAGTTTIMVNVSNSGDFEQTVQFDVTVAPALISISDAPTVEEGDTLHYTVSLNTPPDPVVATADVAPDALFGVSLNGFSNGNPGPSDLYIIDEVTGAGTFIGNIGYAVNSIAFDPTTGLMYGSTTTWSGDFNGLLLIDPATGAATEIGAFGAEFTSILGLSFNSLGELFGWHDPGADDPVRIDKTTGAATTVGASGIGTAQQVMAFDNSDQLILVQDFTTYDINTTTGAADSAPIPDLSFDPGHGGADIHNTTGDLWASATNGRTEDSIIRVTDIATDSSRDIDTDVEYLNALAFGGTGGGPLAVTANLAFGEGTTATGGTDFEQIFYSDPELTTEITSVTLGGVNPDSADVYVRTFENNPPFNEPDEIVEVILTDITNAAEGDITGDGIITDSTPPPASINDGTDTGGDKNSDENGDENGDEDGDENDDENGEEGDEEGGENTNSGEEGGEEGGEGGDEGGDEGGNEGETGDFSKDYKAPGASEKSQTPPDTPAEAMKIMAEVIALVQNCGKSL